MSELRLPYSSHYGLWGPKLHELYSERMNAGLEQAGNWVQQHRPEVKVETLLLTGRPSEVIVSKAVELDVGLIVMGRHGLGVLEELVVGSTSNAVLNRSDRPVLIIR